MFEGVVAAVLNRFLGKYVRDLDTENLNVGIFGGDVQLHDLRLRPEALYELDLPIEVKAGIVGRVTLNIPWSGLYTQSVVVTIEDVYVVVGPVVEGPYNAEREKLLLRAAKKLRLDALETTNWLSTGLPDSGSFLENLITTVMNNLQVFVRNVHIRYEDVTSTPGRCLACGLCLSSVSIEFTDNKWKPRASSPGATSVYQLIRIEAFSLYWNPNTRGLLAGKDPDTVPFHDWRDAMERGLQSFCVGGDSFEFIVKPVSAKVKVIVNRSNEARVPKLLVDFVVEDIPTQLSRAQYLSIQSLLESMERMKVSRKYRLHRPDHPVHGHASAWWKYAYTSILEQRVRPYTWNNFRKHREVYAEYRDTYRRALLSPADTELRIDLQKLEDQLDIVHIVIAREHAKIQLYKDDPERVSVGDRKSSWWNSLFRPTRSEPNFDQSFNLRSPSPELKIRSERARGLWTQLSGGERERLFEAIGYAEGVQRPDKPKQYIEHKLNVTLVNCSLSLVSREREVLVLTLTQFLASLETRPSADAYKFSVRAESIVIEGASVEHDLVPIATANAAAGNSYSNFLAVDLEKNPLKTEADFGLNVTMEPLEIVYHEHALSELLSFFCTGPRSMEALSSRARSWVKGLMVDVALIGKHALSRRSTYCINMDIRAPYFVIPESGSMQKGGQVLVVDLGRLTVRSELQPSRMSLEDATQMELEERLYDRLHVDISQVQTLFCDSGDEWWESRKLQDSELHLVPKIRCQVVFSNSVRPDYRQLAKHKLTVSVSSLKLNLSDRRIGLALDFIDNLPIPSGNTIRVDSVSPEPKTLVDSATSISGCDVVGDRVPTEPTESELSQLKRLLVRCALRVIRSNATAERTTPKMAMLEIDRSYMSSDHSDEELELWARTVDLPGFDDNVSPNNAIIMLLRFVVGEMVINLARSSNKVDKPYLLLRVGKLCWDAALMEYGPAIQASIGSIQLVDRLHPGSSGQYLEMISTPIGAEDELATLLYRKVRSNCPDFKSHFHSVEQSLVVDIGTLSLVFHQEAFITLHKYLQYIIHKVQSRETLLIKTMKRTQTSVLPALKKLWCAVEDPPIPQGATKFSYSTRLSEVRLKLCDTDLEFLEMKLAGLESDCMFKANERMVLRLYLTSLTCDDLADFTLYSKVLLVDDDKVIDLKYVRHAPRLYKQSDMDTTKDDVKSDGSVKLRLGRLRLVLLYKLAVDLQHFMEPLIRPGVVPQYTAKAWRCLERISGRLRNWPTRLHVSLNMHAPTLLLPQKSASPNLVVVNLGDFTVENFFKELVAPTNPSQNDSDATVKSVPIIDNILLKLDNVQVSRAVMTLAGMLHVQEPILDPLSLRLDVKRWVAPRPPPSAVTRDLLLCEVNGGMDVIRINLGQRDLATLLAVWTDNLAEGRFIDMSGESHPPSPLEPSSPNHSADDQTVRKLQAFFYQNEQVRRETGIRLTLDGVQVSLFNDIDEILSSPVRDFNHGLCKLELGEAIMSLDVYSDHSLELRTNLLSCVLEDIRPGHSTGIKKIFQSHGGKTHTDSSAISVSTPPIVDVHFRQSHAGDSCLDVLVEQTRLNLSISFLASVAHFLLDALPGERCIDGGFVNQGYVGDVGNQSKSDNVKANQRPPSSADSTSGYFSSRASCAEEQPGMSIAIQLRRPEVLLVAEPDAESSKTSKESIGNALLLKTEILVDYSRHMGRESLVCSLSGLQIVALPPGLGCRFRSRQPQQVLFPCDIEVSKTFKAAEDGVTMTASASPVDIRLCASTVHTILDLMEDINLALQSEDQDPAMSSYNNGDVEDLWSPKKTEPAVFPDGCEGLFYNGNGYSSRRMVTEKFTVSVPQIRLILELEVADTKVPVLLVHAATGLSLTDWSRQMQIKGEVQLQASYFNGQVSSWEPLIEPIVEEENVYRPMEIIWKVFQAKAFPLGSRLDSPTPNGCEMRRSSQHKRSSTQRHMADDSQTSGDETEPEHSMTFIRRPRSDCGHDIRQSNQESVSVVGYQDDSDSENEEGVMEKLAGAIGHLFTGDSSDGEGSESDDDESSAAEPSMATEEASEMETVSAGGSTVVGCQERAVFLKKHSDSVDSGLETEPSERYAMYVLVHARDRFELSVTPAALDVLTTLTKSFCRSCPEVPHPPGTEAPIVLHNDLGPGAFITLSTKAEKAPDGTDKVLLTAHYEPTSTPSSPASIVPPHNMGGLTPSESEMELEWSEDGYTPRKNVQANSPLFSPVLKFPIANISKLYNKVTDHRLTVEMDEFDPMQIICPQRSTCKLHTLSPARHNTRYHVLLCVNSNYRQRSVTVRSPLQVRNETSYAMGLYYKKVVLESLGIPHIGESTNPFQDTIRMAIVEPDETYNVPLHIAYHCKVFVLPAYVDSYHVSEIGLWWQELASDMSSPRDVYCPAKEEKDPTVFSLRALCAEGTPVKRANRSVPNYLLRLLPPLAVHNRLPYAVEIKIPTIKYEVRIEAGEKASVYFLNLAKMHKIIVEVPTYLGLTWTGSFSLTCDLEEKTIIMVTEQDTEGGNKQLGLSLRVDRSGTCDLYLHAPYWVINKTGLPLQIRGSLSDVVYEAAGEEPLLFRFRKHRRRCVRLRAYHSSWSSAFSLDTVGTAGLVVCRDRERKRYYRILLSVTLSQLCPNLSKIVTLLPNFIVTNESKKHLRFMEENERADLWTDLAPQQCVAFWPVTDSMRMFVKYRDSKLVSQHFPITQTHRTVLRMDRGGGLCVEVNGGGDQPFSIVFRTYSVGDAPVRVDNLCEDLFLKIHQQDLGQVALLSPYQSMLYTWDDPSRERSLLWNVYNKKCKGFVADFWKDGYGQERVCFHSVRQAPGSNSIPPTVTAKLSAGLKLLSPKTAVQDGSSSSDDTESDDLLRPHQMKRTRRDKVIVYWVSYLEGHQRVLLFTQDERIAYQARRCIHSERSQYELFLSLSGVGVSLSTCTGIKCRELAYLSLSDSAPVWEVSVSHRWKSLTLELASWMEDKWRQNYKKAQMKDYVHVDFEKMHMVKPFYGEVRRRYAPALWVQCRRSEHHSYLQLRLNRLQLDNQMPNAHFSTVLAPAPLPRNVARRGNVKPCIEVVALKRHRPVYNQEVYKYIKCLVQEMCVQLDRGFVQAVCDACGFGTRPRTEEKDKPAVRLRADLAVVHQPLSSIACKTDPDRPKSLVDHLHLSPLRIKLSVCPRGNTRSDQNLGCCDILDYVLNALVPSLTEVKNVRLKMAYFERKGLLISQADLVREVVRHYSAQLLQQIHVMVLGQDVLGNPYGLVTDFTDGFGEFFYEPFLGSVESPDEFADGLCTVAQTVLAHVVGSDSSALLLPDLCSLIPGISFQDEYKKKQRAVMQENTDLPELARAARSTFGMGVLLGLSGVVLKPALGAPQEGAEGFFRGTGKGLLGLMTKPSGGVIDCIATAHDGIKRAIEMGEDLVLRARLPRYINPYLGLHPFSAYQATGQQLLESLSRGHYADSDTYWAHSGLDRESKTTLLVSLQHVFLVERCRQWGACDLEWMVRVDDIMLVPTIEENRLIFKVRQDESYSAVSGDERSVTCEDPAVLTWLRDKVEAVLVLNMEDKPVPAVTLK